MAYGQEYKIRIDQWQLNLWSSRGLKDETTKANASYSSIAKWGMFQDSKLTITQNGQEYNFTDLPFRVKIFVGIEGDGFVVFNTPNERDETNAYLEIMIHTPAHIDAATMSTLTDLTIRLGDVVVGKHVGRDGSEATTDKRVIMLEGYDMNQNIVVPEDAPVDKVAVLSKQLGYLTYAVLALGTVVLFKLFHH